MWSRSGAKGLFQGTLLVVSGICPDGMVAGNLLLSAATLLCGLTFTGIANLADVLNLITPSKFFIEGILILYPVIHTNHVI